MLRKLTPTPVRFLHDSMYFIPLIWTRLGVMVMCPTGMNQTGGNGYVCPTDMNQTGGNGSVFPKLVCIYTNGSQGGGKYRLKRT